LQRKAHVQDDVIGEHEDIDPGKIVVHDWKKLRSIWKALNAEYKAAVTRFTLSGTNESNFYDFCNGKLDTYYLRLNLAVMPQLNDTVQASLPSDCALSSENLVVETTINGSGSKIKKHPNEVATAISKLADKMERDDLVKEKIDYLRHEEERRKKEDDRRQLDADQVTRKRLFDEWQDIQSNLRGLRSDLNNPNLPDDVRQDIMDDDAQLRAPFPCASWT
jgi:ribosome-associated translation inhibitor RaiA